MQRHSDVQSRMLTITVKEHKGANAIPILPANQMIRSSEYLM